MTEEKKNRRPLTDDERKLLTRRLESWNETIQEIKDEIYNVQFKLDFQLEHNYRKQKKALQNEKKQYEQQLNETQWTIDAIRDQLEFGFEVKNKNNEGDE